MGNVAEWFSLLLAQALQPPGLKDPPMPTAASPGVMLIVCDSSIPLLPHIYATFSAAVLRRCELCGHAAVALR